MISIVRSLTHHLTYRMLCLPIILASQFSLAAEQSQRTPSAPKGFFCHLLSTTTKISDSFGSVPKTEGSPPGGKGPRDLLNLFKNAQPLPDALSVLFTYPVQIARFPVPQKGLIYLRELARDRKVTVFIPLVQPSLAEGIFPDFQSMKQDLAQRASEVLEYRLDWKHHPIQEAGTLVFFIDSTKMTAVFEPSLDNSFRVGWSAALTHKVTQYLGGDSIFYGLDFGIPRGRGLTIRPIRKSEHLSPDQLEGVVSRQFTTKYPTTGDPDYIRQDTRHSLALNQLNYAAATSAVTRWLKWVQQQAAKSNVGRGDFFKWFSTTKKPWVFSFRDSEMSLRFNPLEAVAFEILKSVRTLLKDPGSHFSNMQEFADLFEHSMEQVFTKGLPEGLGLLFENLHVDQLGRELTIAELDSRSQGPSSMRLGGNPDFAEVSDAALEKFLKDSDQRRVFYEETLKAKLGIDHAWSSYQQSLIMLMQFMEEEMNYTYVRFGARYP